ncbi:MAG: zinc ribbon domain-containing protein [Desulfosudaceae bacterium]
MPIYEYQCDKCGRRFESLVMGKKEPSACELCGAEGVKRIMSACGFLSKNESGETVSQSAGTSACSGCTAGSCASCG